MSTQLTRKARIDAERNRHQVVATARAAFAADGLDLPMREIARRAGLGVATLYRHFPSRTDLVSAVLAGEIASCEAEMGVALADPDPGRGLRTIVQHFAERQTTSRGLNEALLGSHAAGAAFADVRRQHAAALEEVFQRAQINGAMRDDVSIEDVRVGLLAIASFGDLPTAKAIIAVPRLAALLLAALFCTPNAPKPNSRPLDPTATAGCSGGGMGSAALDRLT